MEERRITALDWVERITMESTPLSFPLANSIVFIPAINDSIFVLALSEKAVTALELLQSMQRQWSGTVSLVEAERFQYRLGALILFTAGGVLRPSSVSGLVMAGPGEDMKSVVDSIRLNGYDGALTYATNDVSCPCILLNLLAFKNMASYGAEERLCYVLCPVVSELLRFFVRHIRSALNPSPLNRLAFVKSNGSWFDSCRDGFGRVCGEKGLLLGTSVRVVRHIVSSAVARAGLDEGVRADICAANLHTVAVADRYYVLNARDQAARPSRGGHFERGLGQSMLFRVAFRAQFFHRLIYFCYSVLLLHAAISRCLWRPA